MMGHRAKLVGGDEQDCFTGWRRLMVYLTRPKVKHKIKKRFSRRMRRMAKEELK